MTICAKRGTLSFDQRPAMIVVPRSAEDVAAAVRHAVANGLEVAIQATGHGVARSTDGDMLIVTKELDEVTIDDDAWTARIGAGLTWGPVLEAAQDAGLAPLLASTTGVGAIGYTLGGGMGWLARRYGLSADLVRSFEIVTVDGAIRHVSAEHDQELFWALRGGGAGTLGVVTAMESTWSRSPTCTQAT